jgi:CRP-like cAMP-binding protein/hemerythrin-like domain-containing protein
MKMMSALERLLAHIDERGTDDEARASARQIMDFFAGPGRDHHAQEEQLVFPGLLASTDLELVQHVRRLQQDHGWLEEDWRELSPHIEAIAKGYSWYDLAVLREAVPVFKALYEEHIALEETVVYPAAKLAHKDRVTATATAPAAAPVHRKSSAATAAASLLAALDTHPFVEGLTPAQIDKLRALAREARFAQGETIFSEGDNSQDFFLVVSGRVALEMIEPDHVLRVQTLEAGDELGWSSVLSGRSKYFGARALEPVQALAFDGPRLLQACRDDNAFGFAFMLRMLGVVSERLQATRLQLHDMHSPKAKRAGT